MRDVGTLGGGAQAAAARSTFFPLRPWSVMHRNSESDDDGDMDWVRVG